MRHLELPGAVLLVNVSESLTLLAVLHQAGCCQNEQYVDANEREHGCENVVDENVGETRQGRGAALDQLGGGGTGAGGVGDKRRRCAVEVTTALKLDILSVWWTLSNIGGRGERTRVCIRDWTSGGCEIQISENSCFVFNVVTHKSTPRMRLKRAFTAIM